MHILLLQQALSGCLGSTSSRMTPAVAKTWASPWRTLHARTKQAGRNWHYIWINIPCSDFSYLLVIRPLKKDNIVHIVLFRNVLKSINKVFTICILLLYKHRGQCTLTTINIRVYLYIDTATTLLGLRLQRKETLILT